jgi:hypothetical protein
MNTVAMLSKAPGLSSSTVHLCDKLNHRCWLAKEGAVSHPSSRNLVGEIQWGNVRELEIDCECDCCWEFFLDSLRPDRRGISGEGSEDTEGSEGEGEGESSEGKGAGGSMIESLRVWSMPPPSSWPDFCLS